MYGNEESLFKKFPKLSEGQIRSVVQCFSADLTAVQTTQICGLKRDTVNRIYRGLCERIFVHCKTRRPFFGIVDVAESFFSARRVKGNRGRGSHGKTVVFGIFECAGKVYAEIVPDCSKPTPQGIIRGCRPVFRFRNMARATTRPQGEIHERRRKIHKNIIFNLSCLSTH